MTISKTGNLGIGTTQTTAKNWWTSRGVASMPYTDARKINRTNDYWLKLQQQQRQRQQDRQEDLMNIWKDENKD